MRSIAVLCTARRRYSIHLLFMFRHSRDVGYRRGMSLSFTHLLPGEIYYFRDLHGFLGIFSTSVYDRDSENLGRLKAEWGMNWAPNFGIRFKSQIIRPPAKNEMRIKDAREILFTQAEIVGEMSHILKPII